MEISQKQGRSRRPTMSDIAKRCGVDQSTVSHVLRGTGRQSQETIDRVLKVANEIGYDPMQSHAARQMALSRFGRTVINHTLGLFLVFGRQNLNNYFLSVLQGTTRALGGTEFGFYTCDTFSIESSLKLPISYRRGDIDGVLAAAQNQSKLTLELLRNDPGFGNRPIVGIVEHLDGCSGVYADHYQVGHDAITHLLDLGHRHIMHFVHKGEVKPDAHGTRLCAYVDACVERGLDPERHLHRHLWMFGDHELSSSKQSLIEDLRQHPEVTAILAKNDLQALAIYEALLDAGYRVPEDISLVGSDDTEAILAENRENILTTIRLPLTEIGYEGTKLLIRRVLKEEKEDRDIVMPVELVVRKSAAPPKKAGERR